MKCHNGDIETMRTFLVKPSVNIKRRMHCYYFKYQILEVGYFVLYIIAKAEILLSINYLSHICAL